MPSPFPGMDPYLEGYEWEPFHTWFMGDIADALSPRLPERYIVRPQRRVYVEHTFSEDHDKDVIIADGLIARSVRPASGQGTAVLAPAMNEGADVEVILPMPETHYETYLTIKEAETMEVVTVIELLSPTNKRPGDGRHECLQKREEVLKSRANLVELDLLRGGRRLPTVTPLPQGDYYALTSRAGRRPRATAVAWTIRDLLPTIRIPLRPGDADVALNLQEVFSGRYDRAAYGRGSMYRQPLDPPLGPDDTAWAAESLRAAGMS